MGKLILYSFLAGVVGTGLGGVISIFVKPGNKATMTYLLNLAGGLMISITCFKLIPESVKLGNVFITVIGVIFGAVLIQVLNSYIDWTENRKNAKLHADLSEMMHTEELTKEIKHGREHIDRGEISDAKIFRAGFIMLFAIALHNLPEGLAIGSTGAYNEQIGIVLAFTIAFHNIPEGMAIGLPLSIGGLERGKTILWTALSGFTTVIGALIGYLIGGISDIYAAFSLSFAGGAMLYVTFGEIMPQAILMCNNRKSILYTLIGFVIGMVVMYLT